MEVGTDCSNGSLVFTTRKGATKGLVTADSGVLKRPWDGMGWGRWVSEFAWVLAL